MSMFPTTVSFDKVPVLKDYDSVLDISNEI